MFVRQENVLRNVCLVILVVISGCTNQAEEPELGDLGVDAAGNSSLVHEDQGNGLVTLDLTKAGISGLIDVPKGTRMDVVVDPDGIGDESGKTTEIYFHNDSFFYLRMRRSMPLFGTIERVHEHVLGINIDVENKIDPNAIEIVDGQVVIYHVLKETPAPEQAAYGLFSLVSLGDQDYLLDNWDGDNCTREQIELMSECVRSLRPKEESAE